MYYIHTYLKQNSNVISVEFMVCVTVVDATTNNPITNVDFVATENGSPSSSDLDDPDGEICYSVSGGTNFEVTVLEDGYNDGVRNGLIEQDVNWVVALNPMVSTKLLYILSLTKSLGVKLLLYTNESFSKT